MRIKERCTCLSLSVRAWTDLLLAAALLFTLALVSYCVDVGKVWKAHNLTWVNNRLQQIRLVHWLSRKVTTFLLKIQFKTYSVHKHKEKAHVTGKSCLIWLHMNEPSHTSRTELFFFFFALHRSHFSLLWTVKVTTFMWILFVPVVSVNKELVKLEPVMTNKQICVQTFRRRQDLII